MKVSFVDIHCHILPGIDDGPPDWEESLAMARLAIDDGTATIIATPHQLGAFDTNCADLILPLVAEFNDRLNEADLPLRVLAGGELRITPSIINDLRQGTALTLGNHLRHVLIELPHDVYFPLDSLLAELSRRKITPVLAHPERNGGLLRQPAYIASLVEAGVLMQVTASSLFGAFGRHCQRLSEQLIADGFVHFIASDGHRSTSRRPLLRRAFDRVVELVGEEVAYKICCQNPLCVAENKAVAGPTELAPRPKRAWPWRRAAG